MRDRISSGFQNGFLAQRIRASVFGTEGRGFESLRGHFVYTVGHWASSGPVNWKLCHRTLNTFLFNTRTRARFPGSRSKRPCRALDQIFQPYGSRAFYRGERAERLPFSPSLPDSCGAKDNTRRARYDESLPQDHSLLPEFNFNTPMAVEAGIIAAI